MKIFFDCTYLRNKHTGVDEYFFGLIYDLLKIDQTNFYTIIVDSRYDQRKLLDITSNYTNVDIKTIYSPLPLQVFYASFIFPLYCALKKYDIYHNPYFFGPLIKYGSTDVKTVITVHDLYYRLIPHLISPLMRTILKVIAERAIKKANKLIVISEQTKQDVYTYLDIDKSRMALVYQALREKDKKGSFSEGLTEKVAAVVEKDYILSVGLLSPHKGFDDLIKAFYELKKTTHVKQDIMLISVGKDDTDFAQKLRKLIRSLNLEGSVRMLGYVNDHEIEVLYKNANLVVVPSHYEGFGYPVLEAMNFGTPVITREASSLKEVMGKDGFFFSTVEELASKMSVVLSSQDETQRMIDYGKQQLKKFSSEIRAQKTLSIYTSLTSSD